MGASASICDVDDLQKEFAALKPSLSTDQVESLQKTFDTATAQKKSEFYVIGVCRKALDELNKEVAAPPADTSNKVEQFVVREVKIVGGVGGEDQLAALGVGDAAPFDRDSFNARFLTRPDPGDDFAMEFTDKPLGWKSASYVLRSDYEEYIGLFLQATTGDLVASEWDERRKKTIYGSRTYSLHEKQRGKGKEEAARELVEYVARMYGDERNICLFCKEKGAKCCEFEDGGENGEEEARIHGWTGEQRGLLPDDPDV